MLSTILLCNSYSSLLRHGKENSELCAFRRLLIAQRAPSVVASEAAETALEKIARLRAEGDEAISRREEAAAAAAAKLPRRRFRLRVWAKKQLQHGSKKLRRIAARVPQAKRLLEERLEKPAKAMAWRGASRLCGPLSGFRRLPKSVIEELDTSGFAVIPNWLPSRAVSCVVEDALSLEAAGLAHRAGVGGAWAGAGRESATGWAVDSDVRRTAKLWIHKPWDDRLSRHGQLVSRLSLLRSMECLRSQLSRHRCGEGSLPRTDGGATSAAYLYYPEGGFYHRHVDGPQYRWQSPVREHREISFLLYLDEGWRAEWGGALRIFLPDQRGRDEGEGDDDASDEPHVDVLPEAGTLVLMRSSVMDHEVMHTARPRRCVVGWFCSTSPEPNELTREQVLNGRKRGEQKLHGGRAAESR